MKNGWKMAIMALALLGGSVNARAGEQWQKIGELSQGGKLAVDRQASVCRLVCLEGVTIVNTLVVFNGDTKRGIPVRAKLKKGEEREVPLGNNVKITHVGMSLNSNATGRLAVYVK
ncbi:MAG: hypothetical protein NTV49_08930 [Kiritimatiellaeota bacterium]|nr:hypothetical protein [Kiritimatiellota bacterium]